MTSISVWIQGREVTVSRPGACSVAAMERLRPFYTWLYGEGKNAKRAELTARRLEAAMEVARWSLERDVPIGCVELALLIGWKSKEAAAVALRIARSERGREEEKKRSSHR